MTVSALLRAALFAGLAVGAPIWAQESGTKIAIINIQDAITRSQEGQQLIQTLQQKYAPKQQEIEAKQKEIADLRNQLNRGANTLSDEAKRNLARDIQTKEREAQRAVEDARGEFNREQQEVFNEIGGKLMNVIDGYARDNGYSIVLNVSADSPVLYAVNEVNITNDVIKRFDEGSGAAPPAPAAATPSGDGAAAKPATQP